MGRLGDKWYRIAIDGDFNGAFYSMDLDGENERQIGPFSQFPFGVFGKSLFYEDKCILATNEADLIRRPERFWESPAGSTAIIWIPERRRTSVRILHPRRGDRPMRSGACMTIPLFICNRISGRGRKVRF